MNRRHFVQTSAALTTASVAPARLRHSVSRRIVAPHEPTAFGPPDAELIRVLALRAVDAAKSAGATYADARLVRIVNQVTGSRTEELIGYSWETSRFDGGRAIPATAETETHAFAVRALVDGAWGFTASPWWTPDEAVTLARDAVAQARDNAQWVTSRIELAPAPVTTGTWTTPMRVDPFSIPAEEKMAFAQYAYRAYRAPYRLLDRVEYAQILGVSCQHVTRAVATSEGSYFVQHYYDTRLINPMGIAELSGLVMEGGHPMWKGNWRQGNFVSPDVPHGTGWEAVTDADLWTLGQAAAEHAYAAFFRPPPKAVEIGAQTVVFDAGAVAALVDVTIARATDLDRIVGDEANAEGTSYLGNDPLRLLGNYSFGTPALTVTATRASSVGTVAGLPTTRWDDEGVVPAPFTMIKDGILQDLATTREHATVLAPYYQKLGRPVASNGCAMSGTAFDLTTVGSPTLVVTPGAQDITFRDMVSSVPRGIAFTDGALNVEPDFQGRQVMLTGECQEIVNGRLGRQVSNAGVMINTSQLWKSLAALGGTDSARGFPGAGSWSKGEPAQTVTTSVVAVPATFTALPVVDATRRQGGGR